MEIGCADVDSTIRSGLHQFLGTYSPRSFCCAYSTYFTMVNTRLLMEYMQGVIFLALALSIITATARIALRLHRLRQFAVDDGLLVFSVLCLSAASALLYQVHSKLYYQVDVSLGKFIPGSDFEAIGLSIQKMLDISSVLIWTAIFTIKVSFLCFFHKLVDRIRNLTIWWRIVFALVIVCGCICIPFTFSICPDFSQNFFGKYCANRFHNIRTKLFFRTLWRTFRRF